MGFCGLHLLAEEVSKRGSGKFRWSAVFLACTRITNTYHYENEI